jgi:hypothetical protein
MFQYKKLILLITFILCIRITKAVCPIGSYIVYPAACDPLNYDIGGSTSYAFCGQGSVYRRDSQYNERFSFTVYNQDNIKPSIFKMVLELSIDYNSDHFYITEEKNENWNRIGDYYSASPINTITTTLISNYPTSITFSWATDNYDSGFSNIYKGFKATFTTQIYTLCPYGSYTTTTDKTSCTPCPIGTFGNTAGSSKIADCYKCPPGSFGNISTTSYCFNCPAGSYNTGSSLTSCTGCLKGSYSSNDGSSVCNYCQPGYYNSVNMSSYCIQCSAGKYGLNISGGINCTNCTPGYYNNINAATFCDICPPATYSMNTGASSPCFACPQGKYGLPNISGASTCLMCQPGFYNNITSATYCYICPPATYNNNTGSSVACIPCTSGKYGSNTIRHMQHIVKLVKLVLIIQILDQLYSVYHVPWEHMDQILVVVLYVYNVKLGHMAITLKLQVVFYVI